MLEFLEDEPQVTGLGIDPQARRVRLRVEGLTEQGDQDGSGDGGPEATALQVKLFAVLRELDEHWLGRTEASATVGMGIKSTADVRLSHEGEEWLVSKPGDPSGGGWREFRWPDPEAVNPSADVEWKLLAGLATGCGVALVAGWLVHVGGGAEWLSRGLLAVALVCGGWDAAIDAAKKARHGRFDIHFLMLAVAAGAVAIGAWTEGALLLFLFSTAGALEHYAMHRTYREIGALTKAAPRYARLLGEDGGEVETEVHLLRPGHRLRVRPDELFPTDATVLEGESAADESNLTGEAAPVPKHPGGAVYSGTLNLWGRLDVEVTRPASASALQKIIALIHTAQQMRAPSQRFTDRFGTGYTFLTLGLVSIMFFVWWLIVDLPPMRNTADQTSAFYRAMTLLVVMSPCALVLSIPSAILAAIAWGARRGVLFRGGAVIEKLAEVNTIAMDKTGTLTMGEPKVEAVESFPAGMETAILETALSLEANSNHPIARAIVEEARRRGMEPQAVSEFRSISGQGIRGRTNAGVSYAGRRELLMDSAFAGVLEQVPEAPLGVTEVWVVLERQVGRILLRDRIREGSREVLQRLSAEGVRTVMLTGDRRAAAAEVARDLGMTEVRAGLKPEDKVEAIRELGQGGQRVAMVGDGVNDAPSLAAAYVSVAMGTRGSDAATEQSDVILMQDRIEKLLSARLISRRARAVIRQNLFISLSSVGVMAFFALFGVVPLTLGVITHEGSTVVVCLNSLRLLFVREPHRGTES